MMRMKSCLLVSLIGSDTIGARRGNDYAVAVKKVDEKNGLIIWHFFLAHIRGELFCKSYPFGRTLRYGKHLLCYFLNRRIRCPVNGARFQPFQKSKVRTLALLRDDAKIVGCLSPHCATYDVLDVNNDSRDHSERKYYKEEC